MSLPYIAADFCCSSDELQSFSHTLFSLSMLARKSGFSSRAVRSAWARLIVTADVAGQCIEESEADRVATQAHRSYQRSCKIMYAISLRCSSNLVSAGWPGEISVCVGYTCVHFQSMLCNTTRSL